MRVCVRVKQPLHVDDRRITDTLAFLPSSMFLCINTCSRQTNYACARYVYRAARVRVRREHGRARGNFQAMRYNAT